MTCKRVKENSVINKQSVGLVVVGLLLLNVLGPVTAGLGQVIAFGFFKLIGVI